MRKDPVLNIQYVGFSVVAASRIYSFRAIRAPQEVREFTVKVQSETFRTTPLRFQDAPDVCLARLRRELDQETAESHAKLHLVLGKEDIQEYAQRRYPRKHS
jgi:hypothetical protein